MGKKALGGSNGSCPMKASFYGRLGLNMECFCGKFQGKNSDFLEPITQGRPGSQRALGPGASCAAVAVCTARCHPAPGSIPRGVRGKERMNMTETYL